MALSPVSGKSGRTGNMSLLGTTTGYEFVRTLLLSFGISLICLKCLFP